MTPKDPSLERRTLLRGATAAGLGALMAGPSAAASLARAAAHPAMAVPAAPPSPRAIAGLAPKALSGGGCTLTPQSIEGPFYLDLDLIRQDITEGKPGLSVLLFLQLVDTNNGCQPISNAVFDVWHADALGKYSGIAGKGTAGESFLRGIQLTDMNGIAVFQTIFPGLYSGRTTHIHFKARPSLTAQLELTGQLYFEDIYAQAINPNFAPYDTNTTTPTYNAQDFEFQNFNGAETTMTTFVIYDSPPVLVTGLQVGVPMP